MIENYITITLNRSEDLGTYVSIIKDLKIQSPIFVVEEEEGARLNFTSDYEHYELERLILNAFDGYDFIEDVGIGRKEIRAQLQRYQSPYSLDGWGRTLESPIDEKKYLVRKSKPKQKMLNPEIKVLFEDVENYYYINIAPGEEKISRREGFLLKDSFENLYDDQTTVVPFFPVLYPNIKEAYRAGFDKLSIFVHGEFLNYVNEKKRLNRKRKNK